MLAPQPLANRLHALLQPELGTSASSSISDSSSHTNRIAQSGTSSFSSTHPPPTHHSNKKRLRTMRGAVPVITRPLSSTADALHSENSDGTQIASTSADPLRQRPSIKVRIITWNMHDSLPKGDLEVLLGKAGKFVAPQPGWDISMDSADEDDTQEARSSASNDESEHHDRPASRPFVVGQERIPRADRIPLLPHDDSHPYHLLVIAGQECPWGDGRRLATSVGMAGELGDIGKQKTRSAKEKAKMTKQSSNKLASATSPTPTTEEGGLAASLSSATANEEESFPFQSPPMTQALAGNPLSSPWIGGSQMAGTGAPSSTVDEDRLAGAAWPAIGGKGWSDLCEDWLCKNQTSKKDKTLSGGARLARALSTSTTSKMMLSRESLVDQQSRSAVVTPEISRPTSPIGIALSASAPGTPNQSTFEGFPSLADSASPSSTDLNSGTPGFGNEKRRRLVPKLNLKHMDLARKHSSVNKTHAEESPGLMNSPTIDMPAGSAQSNSTDQPSNLTASLSSGGLLSVPTMPSISRISSSNSLSSLARDGPRDSPTQTAAALGGDVQVQPPTPSGSPSPCPDDGRFTAASAKPVADGIPKSLGPYELVIKERMMGCYMAVYVWRGCKDRIRGASRSHVKSGLLAGRLGNKGGVGISVKLGSARLLFVNAHLAAHEDKVALRLSNVARIKAALKVDSFLPNTDPRSKLEDITEQFDHCFWFGDLNFRIDISRQHADWLLMHKKYDQALAFDQLGKVLQQGDAFKGFDEAPIHFPPTYKYDVLKTLRIKRSKTLTPIKNGVDIPNTGMKTTTSDLALHRLADGIIPEECNSHTDPEEGDCTATCATAISASADADRQMLSSSEAEAEILVSGLTPAKLSRAERLARYKLNKAASRDALVDGEPSDEDQLSVSSSAFDSIGSSSSFAASYALHENHFSQQATTEAGREREQELEDQRVLHENTAAAQGPKLFSQGAAIKAKLKFFGIVRTAASVNLKDKLVPVQDAEDTAAGAGGMKKWLGGLADSPRKTTPVNEDQTDGVSASTLVSPSSSRSALAAEEMAGATDGALSSADEDDLTQERLQRSASHAKRTRFKIEKAQRDAKYPHLTGATAEQIDFLEAQPYDTSSKQRVPSWCDRVLFRSTVPADPDDSDSEADDRKKSSQIDVRRASKVGNVLSSALIIPLRQAAERRHHMHAQRHASSASNTEVAASASDAVHGAQSSAFERQAREIAPLGLNPPVRAHTPASDNTQGSSNKREALVSREVVAESRPGNLTQPQAVERQKAPHLLQRFLHPGKRRHVKALSPSLTVSDLTSPAPGTGLWPHHANGSTEAVASSPSRLRGLGLAGFESKALSSVDLPSQLEERERAFDGAKAQVVTRSPQIDDREIVIPPRISSATSTDATASSTTRKPSLPRSVSAEAPSKTPSTSAFPSPAGDRSSPPSNTAQASASQTSSWMDSISSHLPSFLVPAMSALRPFHHHGTSTPHSETDTDDAKQAQHASRAHLIGPKRGQIECLLYKSLDDREMRILEGRSDHRPVIFVGAIGI